MAKRMSENCKLVLDYLKEIHGSKVTSADVASVLGLATRSVDALFTSLQNKGLGVRTPTEIETEDGGRKTVKFLSLTPEGLAYTEPEDDAE
jgi:Mn-dependent DtxR family transcriptional regulator